MCGRFTQISSPQEYAKLFGITTEIDLSPRYNIAPSSDILVCRLDQNNNNTMSLLHWGLIPFWADSPKSKYTMINARAETVAEKPAYRKPFKSQRCLIPADGFYEWKMENGKQPYYFTDQNNEPLVFAGLWDSWQRGDEHIESCTIIVTEANQQMDGVHDRMPVMLETRHWQQWLVETDKSVLLSLINTSNFNLNHHAVTRDVNTPRNDREELIQPV